VDSRAGEELPSKTNESGRAVSALHAATGEAGGAEPMKRPISTQTHGVIDYTWAASAAAICERISGAPRTKSLLRGASGAATGSSAFTNYEAGLVRMMPMKGHLALDVAMCAVLLAAPLFIPAAERRYAAIPIAFGAVGLLTALLTQTTAPTEYRAALRSATR
jgi:hypothetical protein